jgi:hypothetical protein
LALIGTTQAFGIIKKIDFRSIKLEILGIGIEIKIIIFLRAGSLAPTESSITLWR